jgi:hypothetical protein
MLAIPYQCMDPSHITLGPFGPDRRQRISASLSYRNPFIPMNDVCIVTPSLSVLQYDGAACRLTLDTSGQRPFGNRFHSVQETIAQTLPTTATLQPMYGSNTLALYVCPSAAVQQLDGTLCPVTDLKPGHTIRCLIRLYGVLQAESSRYKLQHFVPNLWMGVGGTPRPP